MTRKVGAVLAAVGIGLAALAATSLGTRPSPSVVIGAPASPGVSGPTGRADGSGSPGLGSETTGASPFPSSSPTPSPSASPGPTMVPGPLDGLPVSSELAARHPIAVMVDDHPDARPQSGLASASIVWQAPAEGGIPRYMLVFQSADAGAIGPVRSAREYFVEWAAEYRALYAHVGGSPQALATLQSRGQGQFVYNADEFRYGGGAGYLWRISSRVPPHNVYTDTQHLRKLAGILGATSAPRAAWTFEPAAPLAARPIGGTIEVDYPWNHISYRYDRSTNTYLRFSGGAAEVDAGSGRQVAPANVVILRMHFGPLNDSHPNKLRLEASNVGSGQALVSTNGVTTTGTWRKASVTAPTLLFDATGSPIALTAGQTFVQVIPDGTPLSIRPGSSATPGPRAS